MIRDLFNKIKLSRLFDPVAACLTDNTATVSTIVDRQGYESVVFAIETGVLSDADAVFSVKVEEGDSATLTDAAAVATAQLQLDAALLATPVAPSQVAYDFSNDSAQFKIGYLGYKRYVRLTVTPTNNTGNNILAGVAILSNARHQPAGSTQKP